MLWEDAIEGYWLEKRRGLSKATVSDYTNTFRQFSAFIGDKHIEQLTASHIRGFLNSLADRGLADKTLANAWIALSSFWSWAEHELNVPHIIRGRVARPRWKRKAIVPYTEDEIVRLLQACEYTKPWRTRNGRWAKTKRPTASRDRALIIILLDTGLRAQEICDLQIGDYDHKTARLRIRHGKANKERYVYLGETARKVLWRYFIARKDILPKQPIFPANTGRHLERENLLDTIKRIAGRAGVTNVNLHRFRHTFAITFLRNGGNVLALQALLGHEKMETIRIYARLAEVDLVEAQRTASPADNWRL
jgi:integrase/recombinase XerD